MSEGLNEGVPADTDAEEAIGGSALDRRGLIAKGAIGAGAAFVAPTVLGTFLSPAAAASGGGGDTTAPTTEPTTPPPLDDIGANGFEKTVPAIYTVNVLPNKKVSYELTGGGGGGGFSNTYNGGSGLTVKGEIPASLTGYVLTVHVAAGGSPAHPVDSTERANGIGMGGAGGSGYRAGGKGGDGGSATSGNVPTGQAGGGGGGASAIVGTSPSITIVAAGGGGSSGGGTEASAGQGAQGATGTTGAIAPPGAKNGNGGDNGSGYYNGKGGDGGTASSGGTGGAVGYGTSGDWATAGSVGNQSAGGSGGSPLAKDQYCKNNGCGGGGGGGYWSGGGGGGGVYRNTSPYYAGGGGGGAGSCYVAGPNNITGSVTVADSTSAAGVPPAARGHRGRGGSRSLANGEGAELYGEAGGDGYVKLTYV